MKKTAYLGMLSFGMAAALGAFDHHVNIYEDSKKENANTPPDRYSFPDPMPYKGQKTWFFRMDGTFETEKILRAECVYECFAINAKNAIKKFNNWKNRTK